MLEARSEIGAVNEVLLELLELRRLIETGAAGLAATRRTDADLAKMTAAIKAMQESVDDPDAFHTTRTSVSTTRSCTLPATACSSA